MNGTGPRAAANGNGVVSDESEKLQKELKQLRTQSRLNLQLLKDQKASIERYSKRLKDKEVQLTLKEQTANKLLKDLDNLKAELKDLQLASKSNGAEKPAAASAQFSEEEFNERVEKEVQRRLALEKAKPAPAKEETKLAPAPVPSPAHDQEEDTMSPAEAALLRHQQKEAGSSDALSRPIAPPQSLTQPRLPALSFSAATNASNKASASASKSDLSAGLVSVEDGAKKPAQVDPNEEIEDDDEPESNVLMKEMANGRLSKKHRQLFMRLLDELKALKASHQQTKLEVITLKAGIKKFDVAKDSAQRVTQEHVAQYNDMLARLKQVRAFFNKV